MKRIQEGNIKVIFSHQRDHMDPARGRSTSILRVLNIANEVGTREAEVEEEETENPAFGTPLSITISITSLHTV